ncbi:MAG: PTS transporter subunit EIIC [Psychrilyobacter sp.]|nr:PTS transporter subunit EIIC [Psychrilyobacter sp.]
MKGFAQLSRIGKALMTPVAILPAAGLLLAFGQPNVLNIPLMADAGGVIFSNLPLLFAVGSAIGLAGGDGVAALAAIVSMLVMNTTMGVMTGAAEQVAAGNKLYTTVMGIPTLQTGVFGGLVAGVIAATLYNKFYKIELPVVLGFFSGKRFVPIVTAFVSFAVALVFPYIWQPIGDGLQSLSVIGTHPTLLTTFVFGVVERALIPFGLHHIFYSPFWFQFGEWTNAAGHVFQGDQPIFFAKLADNVSNFGTSGAYMTGKFPFMMFGLPAAAFAMIKQARPEKRKVAAGILISAALTSFLTGITEPIEFSFLFVAPVLYGLHAILAGFSFMLMDLLNVRIGMTFSGGLIDFVSFGVLPNKTRWWLVIVVGLVYAVVYYALFTFMIKKFNLMTPGRDKDDAEEDAVKIEGSELSKLVLVALGGKDNLVTIDACITRLRLEVKDTSVIDDAELKRLGASGVLKVGTNGVQAIFGSKAQFIANDLKGM